MTQNLVMKRLMALDFMAVDLALFLDTHPHDKEALETFVAIAREGKKVRKEYEELYGPICASSGVENGKWCWTDDPWPWQKDANCSMKGDE